MFAVYTSMPHSINEGTQGRNWEQNPWMLGDSSLSCDELDFLRNLNNLGHGAATMVRDLTHQSLVKTII